MFANRDSKKQVKNEKVLKKLHGSVWMSCTNESCPNEIKVREEEAKTNYLCTKCQSGLLIIGRKNNRKPKKVKKNRTIKR